MANVIKTLCHHRLDLFKIVRKYILSGIINANNCYITLASGLKFKEKAWTNLS